MPRTYETVLQVVGRTPNGKKIAAEKADVSVADPVKVKKALFPWTASGRAIANGGWTDVPPVRQ